MDHVRHDLGGAAGTDQPGPARGKAAAGKSQSLKLAVAVVVLVIAAGLIVLQSGIFDSAPEPLAASPAAQADDDQNLDNPGQPPPKSNFSRKPQRANP